MDYLLHLLRAYGIAVIYLLVLLPGLWLLCRGSRYFERPGSGRYEDTGADADDEYDFDDDGERHRRTSPTEAETTELPREAPAPDAYSDLSPRWAALARGSEDGATSKKGGAS